MKTSSLFARMLLGLALVIPASGPSAAPSGDDSKRVADKALGAKAEKAGDTRRAIERYTEALNFTPEETDDATELRRKIISLARALERPLPPPKEAKRRMARGEVAVAEAKDLSGFVDAAWEFQEAGFAAPWWPKAYFNLGVAAEKAELYRTAIRALELYRMAAPDAKDAEAVQYRIFKIEKKIEIRSGEGVLLYEPAVKDLLGVWRRCVSRCNALPSASERTACRPGCRGRTLCVFKGKPFWRDLRARTYLGPGAGWAFMGPPSCP